METRDIAWAAGSLLFAFGLAGASIYNSFTRHRENESSSYYSGIESRVEDQEYSAKPAIRTDAIYELIDRHNSDFDKRNFYRAVARVESSDNSRAVSKAGARGLMQIMPETWKDLTNEPFDSAFEPEKNVENGIKYFGKIEKYLSERIAGWEVFSDYKKLELMAAAYNGGMGRLAREKGVIKRMPQETQNYAEKVMAEFERLENGK